MHQGTWYHRLRLGTEGGIPAWKAVFLAVEGKVHAVLEQPGSNRSMLFCVKVVVEVGVLLCVCNQPGTTMLVLQPVHYGHVKGPVPGTLTGGTPMDAAMN